MSNLVDRRVISQPKLRLETDPGRPGSVGIGVYDLDLNFFVALGNCRHQENLLKSIFRVAVVQKLAPEDDGLPDVLGRYQISGGVVRFVPHFPFERGVKYRASFDPQPLGRSHAPEGSTLEFLLPVEKSASPTEVEDVFPSSGSLPENLLRFYVRFSHPMQRGRVEEHVALLGPDGSPASDVLYRAPVELWDRSMRHLTILLDPGRLKRGVGPHAELGPPLKAGNEYTLVIGSELLDSSGRPLREGFRKRFRVTEAVRERVTIEHWKIGHPRIGSRQPLVLTFPRPLDWAQLWRAVTVEATGGSAIDGRVTIDHDERRWSFTPASTWTAESYHVRVGSGLEDVCGNSIVSPFDRSLRSDSKLAGEAASRPILIRLG